jgi:hypothetical protein
MNKFRLKNKHVIICCTVLPGYIAQTGRYLLRDCENTTLSYAPARLARARLSRPALPFSCGPTSSLVRQ